MRLKICENLRTTSLNPKFTILKKQSIWGRLLDFLMGRRLEKNYLFCEPCFLSLFRP